LKLKTLKNIPFYYIKLPKLTLHITSLPKQFIIIYRPFHLQNSQKQNQIRKKKKSYNPSKKTQKILIKKKKTYSRKSQPYLILQVNTIQKKKEKKRNYPTTHDPIL